ncbi:hypothetical protein N6B72_18580 [Chryseobacterium soli]|uniref:hypothetical protein n=1 Tax=Chryseobacterium soli TaxID=445961 RepID=UPI0029539262|nr:hypothetical protein [Chryseobacterium soli]MDV7698939.1 hypothetical protein [Chryseobacterium soli]
MAVFNSYSLQGECRIQSEKFFRSELGIIHAHTSAFIFSQVVAVHVSSTHKKTSNVSLEVSSSIIFSSFYLYIFSH